MSRNTNSIPLSKLEKCARDDLESKARRAMAILHPLRVVLTNWPTNKVEMRKAPNFPNRDDRKDGDKKGRKGHEESELSALHAFRDVPLSRVIYIEQSDFQASEETEAETETEVDEETKMTAKAKEKTKDKYYGLAVGKEVHLKYAYNITCTSYRLNTDGSVAEVQATVDFDTDKKKKLPKGKICWVAEPEPGIKPLSIECRLYSALFMSRVPPKDYISDLNPDSLVVVAAFADPSLATAAPGILCHCVLCSNSF